MSLLVWQYMLALANVTYNFYGEKCEKYFSSALSGLFIPYMMSHSFFFHFPRSYFWCLSSVFSSILTSLLNHLKRWRPASSVVYSPFIFLLFQETDDAFYIVDVADVLLKHKKWVTLLPRVEPFYGKWWHKNFCGQHENSYFLWACSLWQMVQIASAIVMLTC